MSQRLSTQRGARTRRAQGQLRSKADEAHRLQGVDRMLIAISGIEQTWHSTLSLSAALRCAASVLCAVTDSST